MAEIRLENVTMSYPLLGSGVRRKMRDEGLEGAGSVISDKAKKSRSVAALENVSIHLKDGDRLGVVGRNGAGKSTLMRVMAGIFEPQLGEVYVEGEIATLFNIGLGLQNDASGWRNIVLSSLVSGKTRREIDEKIDEIAEFSELGEYLDLPVRTYSNGMAMRLKFSAGTMFSPEILLLDEWLGAGDKSFTDKARARMRELVSKAGILVLASHRHRLLAEECNKLLWLDGGRMKALGPTEEILPAFLESMGVGDKAKGAKKRQRVGGQLSEDEPDKPRKRRKRKTATPGTEAAESSQPAKPKRAGGGRRRNGSKAGAAAKAQPPAGPDQASPNGRKKKRGGGKRRNAQQPTSD